jgi:peptidyl-prolyl cis-trans isomerase D
VLTFVLWGIGDILQPGVPKYAAKVGRETVTVNEFQLYRTQVARQLQNIGMQGVDASKLEAGVLRQLIQEKLTLVALNSMGLFVNDELLAKSLRAIPDFKKADGSFNKAAFEASLRAQQINEAIFLSQVRKETANQFLADSLSMDDAIPPASVRALDALSDGEMRDAVLITIPAGSAAEPSEDDIKAYYESNKQLAYLEPETRTIEYVALSTSEIDKLVADSVTPDMVKQAMASAGETTEADIKKRLQSEQRDQVIRDLSNTIEDELAAGNSIEQALAKAGISATPRTLNNVTAEDAKASTDDAAKTAAEQGFNLIEGEMSGLITTPKGVPLLETVKSSTAANPKPIDAVKADVIRRVAKVQARDAARTKAMTIKEALGKEPNWQAATANMDVSTRTVSRIARPSADGKPASAKPSGVPVSMQSAIFERGIGEVAGPLVLENGDQLLGLVTAAHLPKIDPKNLGSRDKDGELAAQLTQEIQARAFTSFAAEHPVKINPGIMQRNDPAQ